METLPTPLLISFERKKRKSPRCACIIILACVSPFLHTTSHAAVPGGVLAVGKKCDGFKMVVQSFFTAIDANDYGSASKQMVHPKLDEFTAFIKASPAFGPRKSISFPDCDLCGDNAEFGGVWAHVTLSDGNEYDVFFQIHEGPYGWRIQNILAGRRFR